jgi:ABC-type microcin C transport system permease subunit YejB
MIKERARFHFKDTLYPNSSYENLIKRRTEQSIILGIDSITFGYGIGNSN